MLKYFENINVFSFKDNIKNSEKIMAHISEDNRKETLEKHIKLCIEYFEKIVRSKNLEGVLLSIEQALIPHLNSEGVLLYREMIYHTIYLHDIGKMNCNFQYHTMKNEFFKEMCSFDCNNSNHSMLSAMIYINEFYNKILQLPQNRDTAVLNIFLLLNAYVISKHHGNLDSMNEFIKRITEPDGEMTLLYTEQLSIFNKTYEKEILKGKANQVLLHMVKVTDILIAEEFAKDKEISIDYYIYVKLMASILLSCDYYATSEFKNQKEITDFGEINEVKKFYDVYKTNEIYKSIINYKNEKHEKKIDFNNVRDINVLRNELFIEAQNTLKSNISENIFFLEAPTGSGKSMVSFNLAFKLLEHSEKLNKIFYIYPFNTLIEQNMDTLKKIFANSDLLKDISVINSLVPFNKSYEIPENENEYSIAEESVDYLKTLLDRQFLHYPIILTTHVSMFRFLFSFDKESLFPLAQIANSVLIFDEIQSYKNSLWKEIITFLSHYAKLLNIKIIIMSATLPDLCKLLDDTKVKSVDLIKDRDKYFLNPVFKDRVKFDFSLMNIKEDIFEKLMGHIAITAKKSGINILMEFITKKSAEEFYKIMCGSGKMKNKNIRLLTGDDSSYERKRIVNKFKKHKDIVLIATQVIEAGVDLDADIGYKDISLFDSEEQFIGRINRNFSANREKGIVYFFNLDNAGNIYKSDVRKEKIHTLENDDMKKLLVNKDFKTYYGRILSHLINRSDVFCDFLEKSVKTLDFKSVGEHMNLIDENYEYSVFLNRKIQISESELLDGEEVWNNYLEILSDKDMEYSEKRVKLFDASTLLNSFIYKTKKTDFTYEQRIGDLFYIPDGEKYFENGKFNREKFERNLFT